MDNHDEKESMEEALIRKAIGYDVQEITEEYSLENELVKRKVTTKHMPPDMSALKTLIELKSEEGDLSKMSDEELVQLKIKLLSQLEVLAKGDKNENNNSNKQG